MFNVYWHKKYRTPRKLLKDVRIACIRKLKYDLTNELRAREALEKIVVGYRQEIETSQKTIQGLNDLLSDKNKELEDHEAKLEGVEHLLCESRAELSEQIDNNQNQFTLISDLKRSLQRSEDKLKRYKEKQKTLESKVNALKVKVTRLEPSKRRTKKCRVFGLAKRLSIVAPISPIASFDFEGNGMMTETYYEQPALYQGENQFEPCNEWE